MEVEVKGGVGEHGRNCFLVKDDGASFLVDCGTIAGSASPYPKLSDEEVRGLSAIFLTHSHLDHTGAIPWVRSKGFVGPVIATDETLSELSFDVGHSEPLRLVRDVEWGRSGHAKGSVWYRFRLKGGTALFSGDYTEESIAYSVDRIRGVKADFAVIDAAYGSSGKAFKDRIGEILQAVDENLPKYGSLVFPVPKFGRGIDLLALFSKEFPSVTLYADRNLRREMQDFGRRMFWYHESVKEIKAERLEDKVGDGIVFISDPQLREKENREYAMSGNALPIMTGTPEEGSFSKALIERGVMMQLCYPVHQTLAEAERLCSLNSFRKTIFYHSGESRSEP